MKLSWTVYLLDSSRSDLKMVKSSLCICFISSLSICISERWVWIIWVISFNLCKIMSMLVPEDAPARTGEAGSGLMGQQVGSVLTPRQALLLLLGDSFSSLIRRPASCYWTKKIHYLSDENYFRIPRQILSRNQNKNLSADWSVGNLNGKTIKTKLIYLDPKSLLQFNGQRIQSFFLDTFVTLVQHIW